MNDDDAADAVTLIVYTTRYRLGGRAMAAAARQLAERTSGPVVCRATETKAEFLEAVGGYRLRALHFIGHSGLYGPMFGTIAHPEQMSRWEWSQTPIDFAPDAEAFFHCCRSARWFAPFFARRYGVPTHGYMSYTTFSARPDRYAPIDENDDHGPVFVVSAPGYKAMGIRGLVRKRIAGQILPMTRFVPEPIPATDASYDAVADLYDAVFDDFTVRRDEWRWLSEALHGLPADAAVLDIGCGNGALLRALAPLIGRGVGVDVSERMIEIARRRSAHEPNLRFTRTQTPRLPFDDASFDVVVSMLSWRYLDWDPITAEIQRVLRPGGRLLVVDMVVAPFQPKALPRVVADKARVWARSVGQADFRRALRRLVEDPRWSTMLRHNPIRAEHEMRWYLPSRFVGGRFTTLNRSARAEILAYRWDRRT